MNTDRSKTLRMVMLAMMVAIGVVISPILSVFDLSVFIIMNLLEIKIWSAEADIISCAGSR